MIWVTKVHKLKPLPRVDYLMYYSWKILAGFRKKRKNEKDQIDPFGIFLWLSKG